jgi:hypothetical protein
MNSVQKKRPYNVCVCVCVCVCEYTDARTNVHPMHPYSTYGMLFRTGNFFNLLKPAPPV